MNPDEWEDWEDGAITSIDAETIQIQMADGRCFDFTNLDCCRNGTGWGYFRVGDSAKRRIRDGAISSPNTGRWSSS